jgi:hypothetical protein
MESKKWLWIYTSTQRHCYPETSRETEQDMLLRHNGKGQPLLDHFTLHPTISPSVFCAFAVPNSHGHQTADHALVPRTFTQPGS